MKHKNFNSVHPYSYYIVRKSDNLKYVGVRYANVSRNLTPSKDFGLTYFTSGRLKKEFKKNPNDFIFRLAYTFDTLEEMWEWERKITLRVYKRKDWANQGWASNYGENPEIGKLISEGKSKVNSDGKTSVEVGADKLKEWIWTTPDGEVWRTDISERQLETWSTRTEEDIAAIQAKRKLSMDFKAAAKKAHATLSQIGEDGLTGHQRNTRKASETMRESGMLSKIGSSRNAAFNKKLGEMSEEEFESFCEGRLPCTTNSWKTRRARYNAQVEITSPL